MKKFFKFLSFIFAICVCSILIIGTIIESKTPKNYKIKVNEHININTVFPVNTKIISEDKSVFLNSNKDYTAKVLLMNMIPLKDINIQVVDEIKVIPCGIPFGIKIFTEGVLIVGLSDMKSNDGSVNPAKEAGLKKGDVIISINNQQVHTNEDVANIVEKSNGDMLELRVKRSNEDFITKLKPHKAVDENSFKAGMWVRDSSAGIGTMTFYNPKTNIFAGLGHGICDVDTGELLPLSHGDVVSAKIDSIKIGQKGMPGELRGYFDNYKLIGSLLKNTESGVYGKTKEKLCENEEILVALKQDIKTGPAKIITTVSADKSEEYDINILSVNYDESAPTKNMIIEITDDRLLKLTGGIVQGMSGSPIIQNNKLVGAVTHVFVNNPIRGYAIFAENMAFNSFYK